MGLDCRLHIVDGDCEGSNFKYSHTIITLPRHYELFDRFKTGFLFVPDTWHFKTWSSECYDRVTCDAYGNRLCYYFANELANAFEMFSHVPFLNAIRVFLAALPAETKVVLYWY